MAPMFSGQQNSTDLDGNEATDTERRIPETEELRENLAHFKFGNEECLRRKRLLGGVLNQNYQTFSLPVSRVLSPLSLILLE